MKNEAVTLTREAPNTYARGGVIFMANTEGGDQQTQDKNRLVDQDGSGQDQSSEKEQIGQKNQENPEVVKKARARAKLLQEELKTQLIKAVGRESIPEDAESLSRLLKANKDEFTPEQIHKWLERFSTLLDDGDLRSNAELRKLRREFKKIQEALVEIDPHAGEIIAGKTGSFNEQLITQFGQYLGVKVKQDLEEGTQVTSTTDGVETLHVAKNIPLDQLVKLAQQMYPEQFSKESQSNMRQFAKDLQKAAVWMNRQAVFSQESIRALYRNGAQLESALAGESAEIKDHEIDEKIRQAERNPQYDTRDGFVNIIMGRHTLTSEVSHDNLYDVYFRRWERQHVFEEDQEYQDLQQQFERLSKEDPRRAGVKQQISVRREILLREVDVFKEQPLVERQKLYDQYLQRGDVQQRIAQMLKGHTDKDGKYKLGFLESALTSGKAGRFAARAIESKLQQDMLQAMVGEWQEVIAKTQGGERLLLEAQKIPAGSTAEQLQSINRLFQPGQKAKLLEYVPAEIKTLLEQGNDFNRTEAACVIASAYEKHVLEQMGFEVYADLAGAHSTLLVRDGNTFYRVDPNEALTSGKGIVRVDERLQEQLRGMTKDQIERSTYRIEDALGRVHVIGGDKLLTSELIGNLAALKGEEFPEGYLESKLPHNTMEEQQVLQELRFALAKKAVDLAPDNYVAWAQMGGFATDGRGEEYLNYARSLNRKGVEEAFEKELLVGASSINFITTDRMGIGVNPPVPYGEQYPVGERASDAIEFFENGNIDGALTLIEQLINRDRANHRTEQYSAIVQNIIKHIEDKMDQANAANNPQRAEEWSHLARFTFEYSIEQIIGKNDYYPRSDWQQPSDLYTPASMATIGQLASQFDADYGRSGSPDLSISQYLTQLQSMRSTAHTIFKNITNKKYFKDGVVSALQEQGLEFLEHQVVGVKTVQRMYDKVLFEQAAILGHWPTEKDVQEYADRKIQGDLSNPQNDPGLIASMDEVDEVTGFRLRRWQVVRAGVVGMQMNALSQRRMVLSVLGDPPSTIPELVAGLPGEGNLTGLAGALKMTLARYFGEPNAKEYINSIVEGYRRRGPNGRQYGLIMGGDLIVNQADTKNPKGETIQPKWKGLWGQSEVSYAMLDTGSQDPKSMKWAAEFMFLGRQDYQNYTIQPADLPADYLTKYGAQEIGKPLTLKQYLDIQMRIANMQATGEEAVRQQFNRNIQAKIREQRLFLGALIHYEYSVTGESPLNEETRAIIWDKVAELQPSKIASLLPKEGRNILARELYGQDMYAKDGSTSLTPNQIQDLEAAWESMLNKLWIAEDMRVKEDAILLRTNDDGTPLSDVEKYRLLRQLNPQRWNATPPPALDPEANLDVYLAQQNITPNPNNPNAARDYRVIQELAKLGKKYVGQKADGTPMDGWDTGQRRGEFAGGLARMTFVFTPFLDDAPDSRWGNLTPDILERLLVGTQDDFDRANEALIGLAANPVKKPTDVKEPLQKALVALGSPLGLEDSQVMLEPWVEGYLELAKETEWGKVLGIPIKLLRNPLGLYRSKLERNNIQADIALSEADIADFLAGLAQDQVVSDDPNKKINGKTMYEALRKKFKADKLAVILGSLRIFTMLFGAAVGWELLKAFLPEDVGKQLG